MIQFASLPEFATYNKRKLVAVLGSVCLLATIGSANKLNAAKHPRKKGRRDDETAGIRTSDEGERENVRGVRDYLSRAEAVAGGSVKLSIERMQLPSQIILSTCALL